jgi:hypothetical protein
MDELACKHTWAAGTHPSFATAFKGSALSPTPEMKARIHKWMASGSWANIEGPLDDEQVHFTHMCYICLLVQLAATKNKSCFVFFAASL